MKELAEPSPYTQLTFDTPEQAQLPEVELEQALITTTPTYTKHGKAAEWVCQVYCPPTLLHPEQDDYYEVQAKNSHADVAKRKHLLPGDTVCLTGTPRTQVVEFSDGHRQTLHFLSLTELTVSHRAPRKTITIFERSKR